MTNSAIKINFMNDVCYNEGEIKLKDTNLPLNGKYIDEHEDIRHYKNGKRHNENGPAIITRNGYKIYYMNGKRHRIDGPAAIFGGGIVNWYINGYKIYNGVINNWLKENNIPLNWNKWSNEDKSRFALHWCDYNG